MYNFTTDWFKNTAKSNWDFIIPQVSPTKILEIGSYEGMSSCYLIEKMGNIKEIELTCIDTWQGSIEHQEQEIDMSIIEQHFDNNILYATNKVFNPPIVNKIKGTSETELMKLFLEGKQEYFDLIYVDGSHATVDILSDAVLSFKLLKVGGTMILDDYLWAAGPKNIDYFPKLAIDAFTTVFGNKLEVIPIINTQIVAHKVKK